MKKLAQFLELNGKMVWFLRKDGTYYIAIKPICEALGVNFNRQFQNIKSHPILKDEFANLQIHVPDDRNRTFLCLPEEFIYGWIFSIERDNDVLIEYQKKCYRILFNYFRGSLTAIQKTLIEKNSIENEIEQLTQTLKDTNADYKRICDLQDERLSIAKVVKAQLKDLSKGQMILDF